MLSVLPGRRNGSRRKDCVTGGRCVELVGRKDDLGLVGERIPHLSPCLALDHASAFFGNASNRVVERASPDPGKRTGEIGKASNRAEVADTGHTDHSNGRCQCIDDRSEFGLEALDRGSPQRIVGTNRHEGHVGADLEGRGHLAVEYFS